MANNKDVNTIPTSEKIEGSGRRGRPPAEVNSVVDNEKLTDQEQLFCLVYVKCFNVRKAYQKAFDEPDEKAAEKKGRNVLNRKEVQAEVKRLKKLRFAKLFVDEEDVLQRHVDIAFADITDFVEFKGDPNSDIPNQLLLKDSATVDGSVVQEIRGSKTSFSIRMVDKQKSLDWLSQHYGQLDAEKRERIEKLRLENQQMKDDGRDTGIIMIPAIDESKPKKERKK